MSVQNIQKTIIDSLSDLITIKLKMLSNVQRYPGNDPDEMDYDLDNLKNQINFLTTTREEFEKVLNDVNLI